MKDYVSKYFENNNTINISNEASFMVVYSDDKNTNC